MALLSYPAWDLEIEWSGCWVQRYLYIISKFYSLRTICEETRRGCQASKFYPHVFFQSLFFLFFGNKIRGSRAEDRSHEGDSKQLNFLKEKQAEEDAKWVSQKSTSYSPYTTLSVFLRLASSLNIGQRWLTLSRVIFILRENINFTTIIYFRGNQAHDNTFPT